MVYPIITRVSTIQGGAGFLPSTVCPFLLAAFLQKKMGQIGRSKVFSLPVIDSVTVDASLSLHSTAQMESVHWCLMGGWSFLGFAGFNMAAKNMVQY